MHETVERLFRALGPAKVRAYLRHRWNDLEDHWPIPREHHFRDIPSEGPMPTKGEAAQFYERMLLSEYQPAEARHQEQLRVSRETLRSAKWSVLAPVIIGAVSIAVTVTLAVLLR